MVEKSNLSAILKQELVQAMGCTEPAACALAGAKAAELLQGRVEKINVKTTRDVLKNAMGVSIPGFHMKGVGAAVALGIAGRDSSLGLDVLSKISPEQKKSAEALNINIELVSASSPLFIRVELSNERHSSVAVVSGAHTNFSRLEQDGAVLKQEEESEKDIVESDLQDILSLSIGDILDYVEELPAEIELLLQQAISVNLAIARTSLDSPYGLSVGKTMMKDLHNPPISFQEALDVGAALAAGGSDARMAGCQLPVVINSGSGNQGLTLTVPIAVVAEYFGKTSHEAVQALCIAELIGLVLTAIKGRLSAQCGAFTAATGMGCGLAWLQGGDEQTLERVILNMIGNLTGVICDGAKMTCALKIHSCIQSAYLASKLALDGLAPTAECGIIGENAQTTLGNLSKLTHAGMEPTDKTILSIMIGKAKSQPV